jgi:hypothetical protein
MFECSIQDRMEQTGVIAFGLRFRRTLRDPRTAVETEFVVKILGFESV